MMTKGAAETGRKFADGTQLGNRSARGHQERGASRVRASSDTLLIGTDLDVK